MVALRVYLSAASLELQEVPIFYFVGIIGCIVFISQEYLGELCMYPRWWVTVLYQFCSLKITLLSVINASRGLKFVKRGYLLEINFQWPNCNLSLMVVVKIMKLDTLPDTHSISYGKCMKYTVKFDYCKGIAHLSMVAAFSCNSTLISWWIGM